MIVNKLNIKILAIMLASQITISCNESTDNQSQNSSLGTTVTRATDPTVGLSSEQISANVGDEFTLDITLSNFPISEGGGVTIQYDPNVLNVSNVIINSDVWNFVNKVGSIDNNNGIISDILFSSFEGVSGDNSVATITFTAIGTGQSNISMTDSSINPFSSEGNKISVNFVNTNVQINTASN
ncbi:MAG: cohesin domain-containing protein [Gammaproteobacteria bacterium]|nr:cohesin domain-containing protein [Gammaproteobacteria bacterium]